MSAGKHLEITDDTPQDWRHRPAGGFSPVPSDVVLVIIHCVTIGDLNSLVATCKRFCAAVRSRETQRLLDGYYRWRRHAFVVWMRVGRTPCYRTIHECEGADRLPEQDAWNYCNAIAMDHGKTVYEHLLRVLSAFDAGERRWRKRRVIDCTRHATIDGFIGAVISYLSYQCNPVSFVFQLEASSAIRTTASAQERGTLAYLHSMGGSELERYVNLHTLEHHLDIPLGERFWWRPDYGLQAEAGPPLRDGDCRRRLRERRNEIIKVFVESHAYLLSRDVTTRALRQILSEQIRYPLSQSRPSVRPRFLLERQRSQRRDGTRQ